MRGFYLFLPAVLLMLTPSCKAQPASQAKPGTNAASASSAGLNTDDEKIIYSVGLAMARQLKQFNLSPAELEIVKRALTDAAADKPAVDIDEWGPKIQPLLQTRAKQVADKEKSASAEFLVKAAAEPGATKTASGLIYKELTAGSGA